MINLDTVLGKVEKPGRYTGGEWGSVVKSPDEYSMNFAFCFPDTYEVGMSHLGMKILYSVLNDKKDTCCERVFAPWTDMEELMRKNDIPLFSHETRTPIKDFDFVGFTLQYEMSYSNILNMLDLGKIPLLSKERDENYPLICAGGPCAYNPEPLSDFIDFFMMGEGEELICEIMDVYKECKATGYSKQKYLEEIAKLDGIYVPSFYDIEYNEDNTIKSITPNNKNAKERIEKRIILDMDKVSYPEKIVVPNIGIVHDRIMLELFRGCTRGCRFCQAGMIYRPVREKSHEHLMELAKKLIDSTGYEEISLTSLSTSDYTQLPNLYKDLNSITEKKRINLSLPSLRIDNFSMELMKKMRRGGVTFAPEAGTQRLRDVINKNINEDDIRTSTHMAFSGGYNNVKLYFMMGLPTETDEDIKGIADLSYMVADQYYSIPKEDRARGLIITVSTSCFVPKPHTPFQWEPMDSIAEMRRKQQLLHSKINRKCIKYNWHDSFTSYMEGIFARGDRNLNKVLLTAHKMGCKFDGWGEHFSFEKWMDAFKECNIDPDFYVTRKRDYEEILPWSHIDVGVSPDYMLKENKKAYEGVTTPQCRDNCNACGAAKYKRGVCFE